MERHGMAYSVALFSGTEQVRVKISYIYIVCHILLAASSGLNLILVKVHWIDSPMLHCFLFFYLFFPILVKVKYKNCSAPENNATECHRICHSVPCRGIIKTRAYTCDMNVLGLKKPPSQLYHVLILIKFWASASTFPCISIIYPARLYTIWMETCKRSSCLQEG